MMRHALLAAVVLLPVPVGAQTVTSDPSTWFSYDGSTINLFAPSDGEFPLFVESPWIPRPGGFESYNKLWFPEPVYISRFTLNAFAWSWGPGLLPGRYTLRFSTTSTREEVPTESHVFFDQVTVDPFELFTFQSSGSATVNFTSSTPYLYDPSQGYLRMSLQQFPSGPHPTCSPEQLADPSRYDSWDCYFWESWGSEVDNEGYRGRYGASFGVTPAAQVTPEPLTLILVGSGLLGVGAARRRRRAS